MKLNIIQKLSATVLVVAILALAAVTAMALTPVRENVTVAAGSATWTNEADYQVYKLIRIELSGMQPATYTAAVTHVCGVMTNTIASMTLSGGAAAFDTTNDVYVFNGDTLGVSGTTNAGSSQYIFESYP